MLTSVTMREILRAQYALSRAGREGFHRDDRISEQHGLMLFVERLARG